MDNVKNLNLNNKPLTLGTLPTSYLASLTFTEQNLIIGKKVDEIIGFINDVLDEKIIEYINERFNDIMINSMYEEETETLVLYLDTQSEV